VQDSGRVCRRGHERNTIVRLQVEPSSGPVDVVPELSVEGAPAGQPVELIIEVTDAAGHRWRSLSTLDANSDPSRPWWSMEFVSEDVAPTAFVASDDRLAYRVRARAGAETAEATVLRWWRADDVETGTVHGDGYRLTTFTPARGANARVLLVPGSTGSAAMAPLAALVASRGYQTAVLAYLQGPGLPRSLTEIPLEAIAAGYRAFGDEDVVVIAASVGTGGAFATLAEHSDLNPRGVIAIAPTSVVWQALGERGRPPKTSMWSLAGKPLAWVPSPAETVIPQVLRHAVRDRFRRRPEPHALRFHDAYARGLADVAAVERAAIAVERIYCPLLLLSGKDDEMWPSSEMAAAILARRSRSDDRHIEFPAAGHFLRPPVTPTTVPWDDNLVSGGTPEGNAQAQADGWNAIVQFLADHLDRPN
jgi:pimeloyl-ACP methyl ester carboxylesterase